MCKNEIMSPGGVAILPTGDVAQEYSKKVTNTGNTQRFKIDVMGNALRGLFFNG